MNEKQNTFRLLKDETPLMTSIWCWLGIHNWTKWDEGRQGIKPAWFAFNDHKVVYQYRRCGNCNKLNQTYTKIGRSEY
jgi:hypothetical protein